MVQERDTWPNKSQYLLACVGNVVGLSNIWRFPYLVYISGGACFLIPYFTMLFLVGIPCLYMEFAIGLITQRGPVHAMKAICPLFKGTGYAAIVTSFLYASYFSTMLVYSLFYFFNSFQSPLPWTSCHNKTWSTDDCIDSSMSPFDGSVPVTQQYFDNYVLRKTSGIEEFGNMRWSMFCLLLASWILIYLFVHKGTKSIGKVVYLTALAPYILLPALLIRGVTLSGAYTGIEYFLGLNGKGDWSKLWEIQVWVNATTGVLNSTAFGFGVGMAFSSFNATNKTLMRDCYFIALVNAFTSILAGFVIFSVLGHISEMVGRDIPDLATAGIELIFISYPQALVDMSPIWLWAPLFFMTLFIVGIDSVFSGVEVINTTIFDILHEHRRPIRREVIAAIVCTACFALAVAFLFDGGIYLFKIFDWYTAVQSLAILAAVDVVVICWIYKPERLWVELESITGKSPPVFMKYMLKAVTPLLVLMIMVFSIYGYEKLTYEDYVYPDWCSLFGWMIASLSLICIPIGAVHELISRQESSWKVRLLNSLRPIVSQKSTEDSSDEEFDISPFKEGKPFME